MKGDIDGVELPDDRVAIDEAKAAASEVLLEDLKFGKRRVRVIVTVERSDGTSVGAIEAFANVHLTDETIEG